MIKSLNLRFFLIKKEQEAAYYCLNPKCDARKIEGLIHFSSRNTMNIEGFGENIVEDFYNMGYLKKITDFYELKKFDMTQDCYDVFQSNYNRISAICDKISDTILNPPSTKKNSSGCMVVAITLSTSIITSLCVLICILL